MEIIEQKLRNSEFNDVITFMNSFEHIGSKNVEFMGHTVDLNPWIDGLLESACDCALCDHYTLGRIEFNFTEDDFLLDYKDWDRYAQGDGAGCVLDDATVCGAWGFDEEEVDRYLEDERFAVTIQAASLRLAYTWIACVYTMFKQ